MDIIECVVCLDNHETTAEIVIIDTSKVCHGCLIILFQQAVDSERNYPVRWGKLRPSIHDYADIIPVALQRRFRDKEIEYATPPTERIYCKQPQRSNNWFNFNPVNDKCGDFVGQRVENAKSDPDAPRAECPTCHADTCLGCGEPYRFYRGYGGEAHACKRAEITESEAAAFEGLVRGKDYQICPNKRCGRRIELQDGCNHVHCMCSQQLCFVCGDPAATGSQHWTSTGPDDVKCPRYNHPSAQNALWEGRNGVNVELDLGLAADLTEMFHRQPEFGRFRRLREGQPIPRNQFNAARRNRTFGLPAREENDGVHTEAGAEDVARRARVEEVRRRGGARARAIVARERGRDRSPEQGAARRFPGVDDLDPRVTHPMVRHPNQQQFQMTNGRLPAGIMTQQQLQINQQLLAHALGQQQAGNVNHRQGSPEPGVLLMQAEAERGWAPPHPMLRHRPTPWLDPPVTHPMSAERTIDAWTNALRGTDLAQNRPQHFEDQPWNQSMRTMEQDFEHDMQRAREQMERIRQTHEEQLRELEAQREANAATLRLLDEAARIDAERSAQVHGESGHRDHGTGDRSDATPRRLRQMPSALSRGPTSSNHKRAASSSSIEDDRSHSRSGPSDEGRHRRQGGNRQAQATRRGFRAENAQQPPSALANGQSVRERNASLLPPLHSMHPRDPSQMPGAQEQTDVADSGRLIVNGSTPIPPRSSSLRPEARSFVQSDPSPASGWRPLNWWDGIDPSGSAFFRRS